MHNLKIGIFLRDYEFAFNLGESIAASSRQMSVSICKDESDFADFDAVISDCKLNTPNNIILVSSMEEESTKRDDYRIFRYTDASGYVKKIAYFVYEATGKVISYKDKNDIDVICVISPYGGSGVSEISAGICKALNDFYGKRCIYVNLSAFCHEWQGDADSDGNFRKLMYYLKYKDELPVECFVGSGEAFDYVNRDCLCLHMPEFTCQMFQAFCKAVSGAGKWRYVVFDIGNDISMEKVLMLRQSDYVIAVRDMRCFDAEKEEAFYRALGDAGVSVNLYVANFCSVLDDIDEDYLDIQMYEDIHSSTEFQMKMSVLGRLAGGENE